LGDGEAGVEICDLGFTIDGRLGTNRLLDINGAIGCNGWFLKERYSDSMTRKEFSSRSEAISKLFAWWIFFGTEAIFAIMIAGPFLRKRFGDDRIELAGNILSAIALPIILCGMGWLPLYLARKRGVVCPACNKALVGKSRRTALLTGKCSRCHADVFATKVNAPGDRAKRLSLSKDQFIANIESLSRKALRRDLVLLIIIAGLAFGGGALSRYLQSVVERGGWDYLIPLSVVWIARIILIVLITILLSIPLLIATVKVKADGVPCPECHRPLSEREARAAVEAGICVHCGALLFEEVSPEACR
jgi:ribosomal protein L37AE/L43A